MNGLWTGRTTALLGMAAAALVAGVAPARAAGPLPDPKVDVALASATQTAVFAGGCFWGVEAVFEHLKGVAQAVSGYSGGSANTARYDRVSSGGTGHAEAVRVTYDPSRITYGQLLKVFFSVAHDPTELNRQGPDVGTQYRSAIFYANEEQKRVAEAYIAQLQAARVFRRPIVTQVNPLRAFHEAEPYHQDYLVRNPTQPYIVIHDLPKLANLQRQYPALFAGKQGSTPLSKF
ncbi:MAG: peptide-methionine (S)-S-oxide reductase MsrA [Betaproteobacteria bacterium]|nr:peptide-methionine (S)-S-oxide reductase MsrA [Betaproteobacteria bacterium]